MILNTLARPCLETTLRVLINLTHDNRQWCEGLLRNEMMLPTVLRVISLSHRGRQTKVQIGETGARITDGHEEKAAAHLDRLCLALGLFTNLVQVVGEVKNIIADIGRSSRYSVNAILTLRAAIDPACPGNRACTAACCCPSTVDAITFLAGVYTEQCESTHDLDAVICGHMAILLGLLLRDSPRNQRLLLEALPGSSNNKKLHLLIENAKEFTAFYVGFTQKVAESQSHGHEDEQNSDDQGDYELAEGRASRDLESETVAKNVIAYLEELRQCL